jgi:hypothetical protein
MVAGMHLISLGSVQQRLPSAAGRGSAVMVAAYLLWRRLQLCQLLRLLWERGSMCGRAQWALLLHAVAQRSSSF